MTGKAFAGGLEVVYVALKHAYHSGMTITMAPQAPEHDNPMAAYGQAP